MDNVKIKQALRDEQINIFMMTEGISVYLKYAQVFLCKHSAVPDKQKGGYYLLDRKRSLPSFEMTEFGQKISATLVAPKLMYVAKIDCQLKIKVSMDIFKDINNHYFPVWKSEAPYKYFNGLTIGYLIMYRVYEILDPIDLSLLAKGRKGRNSVYGLYDAEGNDIELTVLIKDPVLNDDEFLIIKQDIIRRLEDLEALIDIIN